MGEYKHVQGEEIMSGDIEKKNRKAEEQDVIGPLLGYLPSTPSSEQQPLEWHKKATGHLPKLLST